MMAVWEIRFRPPRCFLRPEWKEIQKLLLYMCLHSCNFKTLLLLPGEQCSCYINVCIYTVYMCFPSISSSLHDDLAKDIFQSC